MNGGFLIEVLSAEAAAKVAATTQARLIKTTTGGARIPREGMPENRSARTASLAAAGWQGGIGPYLDTAIAERRFAPDPADACAVTSLKFPAPMSLASGVRRIPGKSVSVAQ